MEAKIKETLTKGVFLIPCPLAWPLWRLSNWSNLRVRRSNLRFSPVLILKLHNRTLCFWDVKAPADPSEHTSGDSTLLGCKQQGVLRDGGLLRLVAVDEDGDGHGVPESPSDCARGPALISSEQEGGGRCELMPTPGPRLM